MSPEVHNAGKQALVNRRDFLKPPFAAPID